jgi:glycosyltransferase involved in cell wall biosynthesis
MNSQPLVSVIIPTYNRAHLIGETLDSVLAQTYQNWECIIVDDGSSDKTNDVVGAYVKKDSRFKYYHRPDEHLPGGNGARNYGFKMSEGEYVNWFDSDDVMVPEKIEIQLRNLNVLDSDFSISQCSKFSNKISDNKGLMSEQIYSDNILVDFIKREIKFFTPAVIIKKEFLKKHALFFDEELKAAQEWEFFSRLLFFNPNISHVSNPLTLVRAHEGSMSESRSQPEYVYQYIKARIKVYLFVKDRDDLKSLHFFFEQYFKKAFYRLVSAEKFNKANELLFKILSDSLTRKEFIMAYLYLSLKQNFNKGEYLKKYVFNE